jgi:hypothetical protein
MDPIQLITFKWKVLSNPKFAVFVGVYRKTVGCDLNCFKELSLCYVELLALDGKDFKGHFGFFAG